MSSINTGKVIAGGLVAGVVMNALDFANNALLVGADFTANATRLGLDPAVQATTTAMATWIIIDFLMGILVVWTYASIRPRFGPGPRTAVFAGLIPYIGITLVMYGLSTGGLFPTALWVKMSVAQLIVYSLGAVAGAWAYKEA